MATLTAADLNARQVMVSLGYHLVGRAEHPAALAEEMRDFFAAVVREQRSARVEPLRKPPTNPHFAAVRTELTNATAPTTKIDTRELLARIEAEEESKP